MQHFQIQTFKLKHQHSFEIITERTKRIEVEILKSWFITTFRSCAAHLEGGLGRQLDQVSTDLHCWCEAHLPQGNPTSHRPTGLHTQMTIVYPYPHHARILKIDFRRCRMPATNPVAFLNALPGTKMFLEMNQSFDVIFGVAHSWLPAV